MSDLTLSVIALLVVSALLAMLFLVAADSEHSPATDSEDQASRVPRWLVVLAVLALAGVVVGVIVYGYLVKPGWIGVSGKKFWDYLGLLIVPAALAMGVYLLNRAHQERERKAADAQQERELAVESERAQDAASQAYLDQMSQLLIDHDIAHDPRGYLSEVARARTLTVLPRLDGRRKRSVLQFLYETALIDKNHAIIDLSGADLFKANLREANLREANLREANLSEADLRGADLRRANLQMANLREAKLYDADLRMANLTGAQGITNMDLWPAHGATMPNGQKYENWLKDHEGSNKDQENTGSS